MGDSKIPKNNLARIRDNQRRSRARRKEYLQELEAKYRACQQLGVEASAEVQAAARKVLDENKRLRALLKERGISDAEVNAYLNASSDELPLQSATASLNSIIDRRILFTGDTSENTQDWNPHDSHNPFRGVAPRTVGHYDVPRHRQQDSAAPDSPHSNASPMSASDAHSTYSQFSAPPNEDYGPDHGSFPHLQYQYDLTPNLPWPVAMNSYTPQSQLTYASSISRVSSANLMSSAHSEASTDFDATLACSQPGSDGITSTPVVFDLVDRYHGHPYGGP